MNITTFASPSARGRMRARSPSEDEETLVYARRTVAATALPTDRALFDAIVRQLSVPLTRAQAAKPLVLRERPNVFQIPWAPGDPPLPWATHAADETVARARPRTPRTPRRVGVPSLVFLMAFGITYGLVRDPVARAAVVSHVRAAAHHVRMLAVR